MATVTVVAELGSSPAHGNWQFSKWCGTAFMAGANAIKVQLWKPEHFGAAEAEAKRPYAFPRARLGAFVKCAHARGLLAGASVFDLDAIELAAEHCDFSKLAFRERANRDLTLFAAYAAFCHDRPIYRTIDHPYRDSMISGVVHLFTVPEYPAGLVRSYARLLHRALLMRIYLPRLPWGWSSHSISGSECSAAVVWGATVIERHLCTAPDQIEAGHSSSPAEFAKLVRDIRDVTKGH